MASEKTKLRIPDIFEIIFDISYLTFDLVAGIIFFANAGVPCQRILFLYGILTFVLFGGDSFHLIPRIIKAIKGENDKIKKQLGLGLQISSITMTIFYILLLYIWKNLFPFLTAQPVIETLIWVCAVIRIFVCLLPQNNWYSGKGNLRLSVLRNSVFLILGICIIILYAISGNEQNQRMYRMALTIAAPPV